MDNKVDETKTNKEKKKNGSVNLFNFQIKVKW